MKILSVKEVESFVFSFFLFSMWKFAKSADDYLLFCVSKKS